MKQKIGKRKHLFPKLGDKFEYWTVIDEKPCLLNKHWKIKCKCKCGTEDYVRVNALQTGKSKGCRCRVLEMRSKQMIYVGELSKTKYSRIKKSARERKIVFDVSMGYLWELFEKQNSMCVLSGLKIKLDKQCIDVTASLDRIDSSKGYIEGNVQWVHKDVNKMKQDYSDDYFIKICKLIAKINDKRRN
jgi:hypothetical protein